MDIFEWDEETPVTANNLNTMQNIINNNISEIGIKSILTGKKTFTTSTTGITEQSVSFGKTFTTAPFIMAFSTTPSTGFGVPSIAIKTNSVTTTGFSFFFNQPYTANINNNVLWIAIEM